MSTYTLTDLGLILLVASAFMRLILVGIPTYRFVKLFDGEVREGRLLFKQLEIEGLEQFVKQELFLEIATYFALCLAIFITPMSELFLSDFQNTFVILTISVLGLWLIFDWYRSYTIGREIETLRNQTEQLQGIAGNVLDGLRYVVHLRGTVARTAMHLGKRAALKFSRKKMEKREEKSTKSSLLRVAITGLDMVTSIPEKFVGHITNWAKESLDERLSQNFKKYASRSNMMFAALVFWSLVPAIWLAIIATMYG